MCGITGIINYSDSFSFIEKKEKYSHQIRLMTNSISHRGRDGHGFFINDSVECFFGHRRLSIIDLSDSANQPMHSPCGRYVIVFNGEIYNYKELRRELESEIEFKTSSDTEVLLCSYILWGRDCVKKLRGIFAFAVWDNLTKKLFVARDHLGVKPVYYFYDKDKQEHSMFLPIFAFASEIKAMLKFSDIKRKINLKALRNYFQFYSVNAPLTLIQDVYALEPGCFLELDKLGLKKTRYWNLWEKKAISMVSSFDDAKTIVKEKLLETMQLQMRSDVPVGAFLSGGLDSTTIVGLMKKFTDKPIHTFNICFGSDGGYLDESRLAKLVAKKFGCNHHELKIDSSVLKREFKDFIKAIDQPSGDGLNSYLVSKFASQHVSVALSGLGGDEVFLGYRYFQDLLRLQKVRNNFFGDKLLPLFSNLYSQSSFFRSFAYRANLDFLKFSKDNLCDSYFAMRSLFYGHSFLNCVILDSDRGSKSLFLPAYPFTQSDLREQIVSKDWDKQELNILDFFSKAELSWYTPGMLLRDGDATSMFSTLEVRVPFLDHEFVELMLQIPSEFKIKLNQKRNKPLLAGLFDDMLPDEILNGSKKGFEMPVGFWLKKDFGLELNRLLDVWWLNKNFVKNLLNDFNRNPKNYLKIWSLFVLVNWIEENKIEMSNEKNKDLVCSSWQGIRRSSSESSLFG